jgi:hypothetical protein
MHFKGGECLSRSLHYFCRPMQYREIVAVTGLGGLYQLLSTKSDGAIVRSLADNTTKFISSRQHNVTPLDSIEIYTTGENVRLHEVMQKMKESDVAKPNAKAGPDGIRGYFREVYPDMDEDRVYTSDMKKMLKWFEILKGADLLDFSAMTEAPAMGAAEDGEGMPTEGAAQLNEKEKKASDADAVLVEEGDEKPAKKAKAKKATATTEDGEEKPAKKTAAKKKVAEGEEGTEAPKKTAKPKKKEGE